MPCAQPHLLKLSDPTEMEPWNVTGDLHGSRWKVQDFPQQQGSNVEQHDLHDDDDCGYVPYVEHRLASGTCCSERQLRPPYRELLLPRATATLAQIRILKNLIQNLQARAARKFSKNLQAPPKFAS